MPATLSQERFLAAKDYLFHKGRSLEQCLFSWGFESAPVSDVLEELAKHQDANGGFFGMGEGPNEHPSPIGSSVAFQHLTNIDALPTTDIVKRGIQYFVDSYDREYDGWPQSVPDDGYLEKELPLYWGNPGGEIVGYLWRYNKLVPFDFLAQVTSVAMDYFRGLEGSVPRFCDLCFLRCARFIDSKYADEIIPKLIETVRHHNLERDHRKWDSHYFIKPYWYAMTQDSPLYSVLEEEIEYSLDFDIRTQEQDGSAYLTFNVEGIDRMIWKSVWTLESLNVLRNYGRIEGFESSNKGLRGTR